MQIVELLQEDKNLQSTISEIQEFPQHIKVWSAAKKLEWLLTYVDNIVSELFIPFKKPEDILVHLNLADGRLVQVPVPAHMRGMQAEIQVAGISYRFLVPVLPPPVRITSDELRNSSLGFLRSMMEFLVLSDIVRAADITRLPVILKRLSATFIGLTSYHSKYAIECINFIAKTQWVLSDRESAKVMLRAFVNTAGQMGKNKPADLQQENNIKTVKTVLRGLGASKTDAALKRTSKAAPVVDKIALDFQKGAGVHIQPTIFSHHKKDSTEDKEIVNEQLRLCRPFANMEGRNVNMNVSPWCLADVDLFKFRDFAVRHSQRAISQVDLHAE